MEGARKSSPLMRLTGAGSPESLWSGKPSDGNLLLNCFRD